MMARKVLLSHQPLDLHSFIRSIPNFPKPGILFRDINPILASPDAFLQVMKQLGEVCDRLNPDLIIGIESRGFLVGAPLAVVKSKGFVPVRKPGKLPGPVIGIDYGLEYGNDRLEIQSQALGENRRVLVVDDLLATGGTAAAAGELVRLAGGKLVGFAFIIELSGLNGREALQEGLYVNSLINYS